MKRRQLLFAPFAFAVASPSRAAAPPWTARLLKGGFDGTHYWSGLAITLAPKWKTYWRVPGDGGIAPQIEFTATNVASSMIHHPLPKRFHDAAGMTIGYKDEVVFPLSFQPLNASQPVQVSIKSFFGVCDVVCIPAQYSSEVIFDPAASSAPDQALIGMWQARVPKASSKFPVEKASAIFRDGKPHLQLEVSETFSDLFVEGKPMHYFGKPSGTSGLITLPVSGAKTVDELQGCALRITIDVNGKGLEQNTIVL